MFSGVFHLFALRNASISAIHLMRLFPRNFKWLPLDYHAKNGIYSDIHRCFTPLTIWTSIDMFIVCICFGKALFSLMKKKQNKENSHTVSPEYAGLHQTNYGVQTIKCSCLFKVSFTIKRKKSCQTNNQQLYSRFFVRKI